MLDEADDVVIGAGPAGAAAAILLARASRRVVLIDRKQFPREKVCGGCLSGATVRRLRWLLGAGEQLPGTAGTHASFVIGSYRLTARTDGETRVVRRADLDSALVAAALKAGARGHFGEAASLDLEKCPPVEGARTVAREVEPATDPGRAWTVRVGERVLRPQSILVATGISSLATRIGGVRPCRRRLLAQQWVQPAGPGLPELGAAELYWLRGGYVGLASPRAGECVVALAAEVTEETQESVFHRLQRLNPRSRLWTLLPADAPQRFAAKGAAGFPWLPRRNGCDNVLLIGDAAGYEEPYTGEGIGQALCSAECAVRAILDGGSILEGYRALLKRHHRPIVRRTRLLSRFLQSAMVNRLASFPPILPQGLLAQLVRHVHVKGT